MTQHTHHCNGPGMPEYPVESPEVKAVNVWVHDSLMMAVHDYSCPVCRENPAVLNMGRGIMEPCHTCSDKGWKLTKRPPEKWARWGWGWGFMWVFGVGALIATLLGGGL